MCPALCYRQLSTQKSHRNLITKKSKLYAYRSTMHCKPQVNKNRYFLSRKLCADMINISLMLLQLLYRGLFILGDRPWPQLTASVCSCASWHKVCRPDASFAYHSIEQHCSIYQTACANIWLVMQISTFKVHSLTCSPGLLESYWTKIDQLKKGKAGKKQIKLYWHQNK